MMVAYARLSGFTDHRRQTKSCRHALRAAHGAIRLNLNSGRLGRRIERVERLVIRHIGLPVVARRTYSHERDDYTDLTAQQPLDSGNMRQAKNRVASGVIAYQ